jgi:hypothetical protein
MGYVEKRERGYRVRYRDLNGRLTSRTFPRKTDVDRFLREMEVEVSRGSWIDPRNADMPLGGMGRVVPVDGPPAVPIYARDLPVRPGDLRPPSVRQVRDGPHPGRRDRALAQR